MTSRASPPATPGAALAVGVIGVANPGPAAPATLPDPDPNPGDPHHPEVVIGSPSQTVGRAPTPYAITSQRLLVRARVSRPAVPVNPGIVDTEMLRSTFGDEAGHYLGPQEWAMAAVPFLRKLGPKDNGKPARGAGAVSS